MARLDHCFALVVQNVQLQGRSITIFLKLCLEAVDPLQCKYCNRRLQRIWLAGRGDFWRRGIEAQALAYVVRSTARGIPPGLVGQKPPHRGSQPLFEAVARLPAAKLRADSIGIDRVAPAVAEAIRH